MASLKLFSAIFIVLLAVATAATYTTTVTTITTTEDEQQGSRQQCQKEIQRRDLNMCESFLSMEQHGSGGSLRMIVQSGGDQQGQEQEQLQRQCCQQLQQVQSQCRCAAIEDVVQQQMKGRQSMHSPQMRKVFQKARNLPSACDWEQPRECSFQQPS